MKHEDILKKISTTVKVANKAQEVSDIAGELGKLDVDLPWRKRDDVAKQEEQEAQDQQPVTQEGESHLKRNLLLGGALGAVYLFLTTRKAKASNQRMKVSTDMRLTPSFQLSEFLVSSEIPEIKEYALSQSEMRNVIRLATVLQQIRDTYGKPIFINSGGRPSALTARSGKYKGLTLVQILSEKGYSPASHSQHMDFSAADWTVENKYDLPNLFQKIVDAAKSNPIITQVILYVENSVPDFIHLGVTSDAGKISILPANRFLLADVRGERNTRTTAMVTFSPEKLNRLIA